MHEVLLDYFDQYHGGLNGRGGFLSLVLSRVFDHRLFEEHPLGFRSKVIADHGDGSYLRIHIWNLVQRNPENVHCHSSDQHSFVVSGEIRNTFWKVGPPEQLNRYMYMQIARVEDI